MAPSASASLESDFDIVSADDCTPNSDVDIFERLEKDLIEQLKVKANLLQSFYDTNYNYINGYEFKRIDHLLFFWFQVDRY